MGAHIKQVIGGAAIALLSTLSMAACTASVDYSGIAFSCQEDGLCPSGQECVAGMCQALNQNNADASEEPRADSDIEVDAQSTPDAQGLCVVPPESCDVTHCIPNTLCSVDVDGNVDEFEGAPSIVYQMPTQGNTVTVRAMWDASALYLAYEVADTSLTGDANGTTDDVPVYLDDCVHWFLDTENNGGEGPNGVYMLADDYHGIIGLLGGRYDEQGSDKTPNNTDSDWSSDDWLSAVSYVGTPNDDGDTDTSMTVEIKIPWATVGIQQTPADMTLLGLGIGHTDKDGKDRESALWMNPGVSFQNAGNWQSVRLHKTQ